MKQILRWTCIALLSVILPGCIETTTLIRVKPDGSGTIEETIIISDALTELIAGLGGGSEGETEGPGLPDKEELRQKASNIGEGVTLLSVESVSNDTGSGHKAIYKFKDINKIRINQNPGENVPSPGPGEEDESPKEYIRFSFKKGGTATLDVINPIEKPEIEEQEPVESATDQDGMEMMYMLRELYKDMKISIALEVEGRIVETNATYRDGSRVTIMEIDFGKLLEDEETFNELMGAQSGTIEGIKEIVKDNPGIKVETQERIKIRFK